MKSERLNSWLSLLANFGVVLGLALLIVEVRQTQHFAETEATVRRLNQMEEMHQSFALSDSLPSIQEKARSDGIQSLSADEFRRLRSWELAKRLGMQSQYIQYVRGYLDRETAETIAQAAADRLAYWEELEIEMVDDEFGQAARKAANR